MSKKINSLIFVVLLFITSAAFADSWDDIGDLDRAWDGQKTITNKEFEKVMDVLEGKQKKKDEKKKRKRAKKISGGGTSLHSELNPDKDINVITKLKPNEEEGILINIPVMLYIEGKPLEKGYYNVFAERSEDKKIYINFYQSQYFKGKVEATETEDDFSEENVNFARIVEYNKSFVKIIFGCIDFNAYAYIPYSE